MLKPYNTCGIRNAQPSGIRANGPGAALGGSLLVSSAQAEMFHAGPGSIYP